MNACTREVLRFRLRSGRHSLVIVDLPGVGENGQRDHEYRALYRRMLPELDWFCGSLSPMTGRCRWTSSSGAV